MNTPNGKIKLKWIDYIVVFLFLAAAMFSITRLFGNTVEEKPHLIVSNEKREWIYPLDTDKEIEVPGALGISRIVIENATVRFADSPCSNRICVQSPPLWRPGDWSACLPNQVFIRIEGKDTSPQEFDAVGLAR